LLNRRTRLTGALIVPVMLLFATIVVGQTAAKPAEAIGKTAGAKDIRAMVTQDWADAKGIDQQFQVIEKWTADGAKRPVKERGAIYQELDKGIGQIKGANPSPANLHHALLAECDLLIKRDDDPTSNMKYKAASQLRKLIAAAGPGSLRGAPSGGWPDTYVKQAWDDYNTLATATDLANRKRPIYQVVDLLVKATGSNPHYSYWLAIILLTLVVKMVTTPLSHLQFESMRNMQRLQPKLDKLRKELGDNPQEFQRQQWQLLKDHNASPQWGCLALLVQMPFLILLYQMIRVYEFQFAHGSFLWVGSRLAELQLSVPTFDFRALAFGVAKITPLGPSLADPDWLLLLLYGVSMYFSTRMSAVDQAQAEQQKMMSIMMPAMFVLIFNYFPSAFILYWLALNVLTTTQQYFMLQKPVPVLALEDEDDDGFAESAPASAVVPRRSDTRKPK